MGDTHPNRERIMDKYDRGIEVLTDIFGVGRDAVEVHSGRGVYLVAVAGEPPGDEDHPTPESVVSAREEAIRSLPDHFGVGTSDVHIHVYNPNESRIQVDNIEP